MALQVEKLHIIAEMKGGRKETIVHDLSFAVETGKKLAIVGRSGCGKTMTAMAILGLLPENCKATGSIRWNDTELLKLDKSARRALRGTEQVLIPQSGSDFLNPSLTVRRQLTESLNRAGVPKIRWDEVMEDLLIRAGFDEPKRVMKSYPFQLSGGMAQRVVMALALSGKPGLVIADEPTRGVDQDNTEKFLCQLNVLFGDAAVLLITHDISVAARCDYILVVDGGRLVELGEASQLINHPKEEYTHKLICDLPHAISHAERGMN